MKEQTSQSQNSQILSFLQSGGKLTAISALHKFNCLRLSGRIKNLRDEGHNIITDTITIKKSRKRIASYSLKS